MVAINMEPVAQFRPTPPCPSSFHGDRQRLPLSNKYHQTFTARYSRIHEVPLQHRVMLSTEGDYDGWIFRALALVNRRRVGEHQLIQVAKPVDDLSAVKLDADFAFLHVDARHHAEVAIVDILVVIVLDLHDLVTRAEGPAKPLYADLARRVQGVLQLDVQRASAEAAPVHRAQHLNATDGVEPKTSRDPLLHDRQNLLNTLFRVRRINEIKIAALDRGQRRHQALIDAVRIDNDPALSGLAKDLGQAYNRHGARCDDVSQHLPRPDGRQLVDVPQQQQARFGRALKSARINGTSTMDVSSTTSRSQSRAFSSLRRKLPVLGSVSRRRWIVLASRPVLSDSRFAARPVGAQSSIPTVLASRIFSSELTSVVLPTPGPPVITSTLAPSATRMASFWLSASAIFVPPSTQGIALSALIRGRGGSPTASIRSLSATSRSAR